jgi:hypothetical protein
MIWVFAPKICEREVPRGLPLRCGHRVAVDAGGFRADIPDWANDQHTLAGRKLGCGLDHFRSEGARLIPPPTADDPFEDEAYRLWAIKQRSK